MNASDKFQEWLPLDMAAEIFGYSLEGLRRRLRQLRQQGNLVDVGKPPADYPVEAKPTKGKVIILWPNPRTALIHRGAPPELLNPKRGKRARRQP